MQLSANVLISDDAAALAGGIQPREEIEDDLRREFAAEGPSEN